jgi:succinate dehydrogenase / fumarate reductase membrane anchor subunit
MVDNRPDIRASMRTPLSRVKGLGASGGGTEHWWLHRVTAMANVPLVLAFVIVIASLVGRPYAQASDIVARPLVAILLVLLIVSITVHMRLGMQTVIEDYVHEKGQKIAALVANTFFAVIIGAACLFSVLKIAFSAI